MKYLVGIQPTGKLSIGNYLGCLKKGLKYQNEGHDVTFLIANYHSLTTNNYSDVTEKELKKLGCKNIKKQTPEYTELFFKLCCKLNLGTLKKKPQFKEKKNDVEYNLGLLLYPVLMAADIIINDPDVVIIGKDQIPHLNLTNELSKRNGYKYYNYELGDVDKVFSLLEPYKKMSKSLGENHVLYLFDNYEKKIMKANTNENGLNNLKIIAKHLGLDGNYNKNIDFKKDLIYKMEEIFGGMTEW